MDDEHAWTRRNVLRTGGAAAGLMAVAGCVSDIGSDGEGEYSVTMPPVGEVEFDGVPESWAANNGSWADMGIALGQDPPEALYLTHRYHTEYYDEIPDVSVDRGAIDSLWEDELDPEEFLELADDVDVFVMDPNFLKGRADWNDDDIERIEQTGTPFFGNSIFSRDYEWHDEYDYLTLYEAFEKLAEVFQEEGRYEAFEALHDEFQSALEDAVPSDETPEVAVVWPMEGDVFLPYLVDEGTSYKHLRDLGVEDALANTDVEDFHSGRGEVDYETLLEINPEYLLLRGEEYRTREEFQQSVVEPMKDHDVAKELTAVQNDDVYRAGPLYQGPIINLVVTEKTAEDLYGVDEELFDRERVADIVDGEF